MSANRANVSNPPTEAGVQARRFIAALRRRIILVRAIESAGVGLAIAAGLALSLAIAMLWVGRPAMQICLAAMAVGSAAGLLVSLLRPLTLLRAAIEADRQANLAELLSTALRCDGDDPWQRAVRALADARCRELRPAQIVAARFGSRAWSGIGLSMSIVLTVAALTASPADVRAKLLPLAPAGARSAISQNEVSTRPRRDTPQVIHRPQPNRAVEGIESDSTKLAEALADSTIHGNAPGEGTASSRTDSAGGDFDSAHRADSTAPLGHDGDRSGGGGGAAQDVAGRGAPVGGIAVDPPVSPAQASQSSSGFVKPIDGAQADNRPLPEPYRDVARKYFQR